MPNLKDTNTINSTFMKPYGLALGLAGTVAGALTLVYTAIAISSLVQRLIQGTLGDLVFIAFIPPIMGVIGVLVVSFGIATIRTSLRSVVKVDRSIRRQVTWHFGLSIIVGFLSILWGYPHFWALPVYLLYFVIAATLEYRINKLDKNKHTK